MNELQLLDYILIVVACCQFADFDNDLHGFFHRLDTDKLVGTVEIDTASENVGTGKTFE
jgi:hypothetical protein